jgi:hypothetical protein
MPLPQQAIEQLKAIYRKHYGRDLTDDEAWEMGHRLLRVYSVLFRLPASKIPRESKGSNPLQVD